MTDPGSNRLADASPLASGTPIVVFGDDWGRRVSTMQHLFRHLTADYPVIWVNAIGHRVPGFTREDAMRVVQKLKAAAGGGGGAPETGDGTVAIGTAPRRVLQARVLPWHHVGPVRAFNVRSMERAIRGALAAEGIDRPPLLVTGTPPSAGVVGRLGEYGSAYFCMDDFLHAPDCTPSMLAPLERELLDKVDVLVATARVLLDSKRPRSGRGYHLPQGVNYDHFSSALPIPAEMAKLPRPIIGLSGSVIPSVDLELVRKVADRFPTGSVVIVGSVLTDVREIQRPNVHLLGRQPYTQLPGFVQAFDVGLVAYRINEHTAAIDSLKVLEYLAAGVPVVTTALPEAQKYRDAVSIADSHETYLDAIEQALTAPRDTTESRRSVARQHTWERRAETLKRILGTIGKPA